jgi:hypothetical protein
MIVVIVCATSTCGPEAVSIAETATIAANLENACSPEKQANTAGRTADES